MLIRFLLVAIFVVFVSPGAHAQGRSAAEAGVLQPGDSLRLTVWRRPELTGTFAVASDGTVAHPLMRDVRVTGVPQSEISAQVRSLLERIGVPTEFVVEPLIRVTVTGEVRTPRLLSIPPGVTVAQAVALAGGVDERGDPRRARLLRAESATQVDLTQPTRGTAASPVRSGDQIVVERRAVPARDYIVPVASVLAAVVGVINIFDK